jgi:hypothetical protein
MHGCGACLPVGNTDNKQVNKHTNLGGAKCYKEEQSKVRESVEIGNNGRG